MRPFPRLRRHLSCVFSTSLHWVLGACLLDEELEGQLPPAVLVQNGLLGARLEPVAFSGVG